MMNIHGYDVPNTIDEMTVAQYDSHVNIEMKPGMSPLEKWLLKFEALGIPEEAFDETSLPEMEEIVTAWNNGFELNPEKVTSLEIDGYTYETKEIIGAKDMSLIEKKFNGDPTNVTAYVASVLFKRTDLTRTEHYDEAHLRHKADLFREQPCAVVIPYMNEIMKTVLQNMESLTNDSE